MKRKIGIITAALLILMVIVLVAAPVSATSPAPTSTTSIFVVGEGNKLEVANPLVVQRGAASLSLPSDGKLYAGDKIATIPLTITNVGRMSYSINMWAHPAVPSSGDWPHFEMRINAAGKSYYPGELPLLAPGAKTEIKVDILISYGSPLVSFSGLTLDVWPGPATEPSMGKG